MISDFFFFFEIIQTDKLNNHMCDKITEIKKCGIP